MATIERFTTAEAPAGFLDALRPLLVKAFDGDFTDDDWAHTLGGHHFAAWESDVLLAHASVIERRIAVGERWFHTGYVEAVATHPERHGAGLGSAVVAEATSFIREQFEFGALGATRSRFYARLGWERWQGPTYARYGDKVVRTPDEDDTVMVLRYGSTVDADLTASLTCEGREGDDW